MEKSNYKTFVLTMVISFCIMYAVMFLNISDTDHINISLNRFYMALLRVSPMALLMLAMMGAMFKNKKLNTIIATISVAVLGMAFVFLRNQTFVRNEQYMKAMIPHYSSAILTSENANIKDPEVRNLADGIIEAQKKEIGEMKTILKRMTK